MKNKGFLPLTLLITAGLLVPLFLRRRMRVARSILIRAHPSEVFPLLNDLRNWTLWTDWSRREEMHFTYSGPAAGEGAIQEWSTGGQSGTLHITHTVLDRRLAYDVEMEGTLFKGILALDQLGEWTRVRWVCQWDGDENIYLRYRDLFYRYIIAHSFQRGLENLKELVEERISGLQ